MLNELHNSMTRNFILFTSLLRNSMRVTHSFIQFYYTTKFNWFWYRTRIGKIHNINGLMLVCFQMEWNVCMSCLFVRFFLFGSSFVLFFCVKIKLHWFDYAKGLKYPDPFHLKLVTFYIPSKSPVSATMVVIVFNWSNAERVLLFFTCGSALILVDRCFFFCFKCTQTTTTTTKKRSRIFRFEMKRRKK